MLLYYTGVGVKMAFSRLSVSVITCQAAHSTGVVHRRHHRSHEVEKCPSSSPLESPFRNSCAKKLKRENRGKGACPSGTRETCLCCLFALHICCSLQNVNYATHRMFGSCCALVYINKARVDIQNYSMLPSASFFSRDAFMISP